MERTVHQTYKLSEEETKLLLQMKRNDAMSISMYSCKDLAKKVQDRLKDKVLQVEAECKKFGNGEINAMPKESVRDKNVFVIGSGSNVGGNINDNLMAMSQIMRACHDESSRSIAVFCGYFPYCWSDKEY